MKRNSLMTVVLLMSATLLHAQQTGKITVAYGTPDERASTRLVYWTSDSTAGEFAFNYGRPLWKKEYEAPPKFDAITKGKVWRMGNNFWSELYTDIPLTISGLVIAPGVYFLGLERSADGGSWQLAFFDPGKVREAHVDSYYIGAAKAEFAVPMNLEPPNPASVEKLTLTLTHPKDDLQNATLKVAWGHLALTAPIKVTVAER